MAELRTKSARATIKLPADHQPHAHPVLHRDDEKIAVLAAKAKPLLGQGDQIGIVVDVDGPVEAGADHRPERRGATTKNRAPMADTARRIDKPRQADADAGHLFQFQAEFADGSAHPGVDQLADPLGRLIADLF